MPEIDSPATLHSETYEMTWRGGSPSRDLNVSRRPREAGGSLYSQKRRAVSALASFQGVALLLLFRVHS